MKNMNLSYCLRLMPVVLLAALTSCNNGGSKNSNTTPVIAQIASVNYAGFQNFGTQSCNFVNNSSYQCFENSAGQMLQTQIISFASQQELCNQLRNENLNSVSVSWGSMAIAYNVRTTYVNNNCQAYPNTVGSNGVIQNDTNLIRNMKCTMSVEAIDGAFGNTGEMQVPIAASGMRGEIYASMFKERSAWIFRVTTTRRSSKYLTVNYIYSKGSNSSGDQLTLRATMNDVTTEVTGFAGSEVSLAIDNVNSVGRAEITCTVTDAANAGVQSASNDYRCSVGGTDQVEKTQQALTVSELLNNTLTFTSSDSKSNVVLAAEGSFALRQGTAVFTANHNGSRSEGMNITARANLSTPVKFKVKRLSKSVDVSCK